MKKQFMLLILFLALSVWSRGQVTFQLGSVQQATPGTYINIPLVVSGLSSSQPGFIGLEIYFTFQQSVLTYDSLANGHPLTPPAQWFASSNGTKVSANWLGDLTPVHVDDGNTLIEFVFLYSGGQTNLEIDPVATIIIDSLGNIIPITEFINGSVTQGAGSDESIWNGTGSWSDAQYWSNGIPGDSTNATINTGVCDVLSAAVCNNLTLISGTTLNIQPGFSVTSSGDLANSGLISIQSDSLTRGSLIIRGAISQPGQAVMLQQVYNGITYLVSTPTAGVTGSVFTGAGTGTYFDETQNDWLPLLPATNLEQGLGYRLDATTNATLAYAGLFGSSTINQILSFSSQGDPSEQGWNLIGNPFPSAFNANDHLNGVNIDKAIYAWDGYRYRVWNGTTGSLPNGLIPSMISVFVRANAADAQVSWDQEGKIHDFSYYNSNYSLPSYVIQVNLQDDSSASMLDDVFIQIEPGSTGGYDGEYDAFKWGNASLFPEIFSLSNEGYRLSINAIPSVTEVPLGVKIPYDGAFSIHANTSNYPAGKPVVLFDNDLQIPWDLRLPQTKYIFNALAGDYPDRFKLILVGEGFENHDQSSVCVAYALQEMICVRALKDLGQTTIIVTDLRGRMVDRHDLTLFTGQVINLHGVKGFNLVNVISGNRVERFKIILF